MTTTTTQRTADPGRTREHPGPGRGQGLVPAPPKARRRWGLFAAMAALVCLGALGNVWLHQATSNATQVVAARAAIERGTVITREELMTVQIGADPALRPVPASGLEDLVGKRAALDVAAGTLLTPDAVTEANTPGQGHSLVGVGVAPAMMPGTSLVAGDRIRVVATPAQPSDPAASSGGSSVAAVVVGTAAGTDPAGQAGGLTVVTVQVPTGDAVRVAGMAATGKVAVVLDSRDR